MEHTCRMVKRNTEIDAYFAAAAPEAQAALHKIREMAEVACPDAEEVISYKLPAFKQGKVFLYIAAFKHHIGIYPPLPKDHPLVKALKPYAGPKGNLQFKYSEIMPFDLIARVIKALHQAYAVKK